MADQADAPTATSPRENESGVRESSGVSSAFRAFRPRGARRGGGVARRVDFASV
jgi:hypothetical protein